MRDGRPNPDIWGNIITCGEIAVGIYEIVGTKKRGLEVPKALARRNPAGICDGTGCTGR